jgi:hypothetical protein
MEVKSSPFRNLSYDERRAVWECMTAIFHGSFIGDFEFDARLAIDRPTFQAIMEDYPNLDDTDDDGPVAIAINNSINEICHGVRIGESEWKNWFGFSRDELNDVYRKWAHLRGWNSGGIR